MSRRPLTELFAKIVNVLKATIFAKSSIRMPSHILLEALEKGAEHLGTSVTSTKNTS